MNSLTTRSANDDFRRLLEPCYEETRAFCRRLARDDSHGDDLFHEALDRALVRLDNLRNPEAFRGWLLRIIINLHRNQSRRGFWRRAIQLSELASHDGRDYLDARAGVDRMRAALQTLPTAQRVAVVLADVHGMSVEEIAQTEGVTPTAVKSRLSRGRTRLRSVYEKRLSMVATRSGAVEQPL